MVCRALDACNGFSGTCAKTTVSHAASVNSLAVSPDGKAIVSGSGDYGLSVDNTIRCESGTWFFRSTHQPVTAWQFQRSCASAHVALLRYCVSALRRVWDLESGACRLQIGLTKEEQEEREKAKKEGRWV